MEAASFLAESGRTRSARFRECLKRAAANPASDEAVHDLRVAIRRVLAWIAVRDALLDPDRRLREARSCLKALMSPLGKLRDAHVKRDWIRRVVPEGDEPSYQYAVQVASDVLRWEARVRVCLGTQSTRRLRLPVPKGAGGLGGQIEAAILAPGLLGKLEREVSKHLPAALDPAHPEALHRMRLAFKKYRYAAEVLLPLFPKATEETAKRLHAFQTLLGTIHDCDVILAEAASFRRAILGREKECALEIAFRAFREKSFREFRGVAGTADGLSRVFGTAFRS
ncbi:MAG TPA: CHAD domain-containing protein [Candidatus Deferrimicrobium sp.]|nr:CHAD domain-containing protein [Candidatus Deferrimicrobium sp.]